MSDPQVLPGILHEIPKDLLSIIENSPQLILKWNALTPLARNEWICWVTIVKKQETRDDHLRRLEEEILGGVKRPCCWPGCPHRRESAKKWFKNIYKLRGLDN